MSERRIGRRLAWKAWLQNPCSQAVSARTLARKVSLCIPILWWAAPLRSRAAAIGVPRDRAMVYVRQQG